MGLVLLVNNDVPVRTLKELVAQVAPDKFSYGSFGTGHRCTLAAKCSRA